MNIPDDFNCYFLGHDLFKNNGVLAKRGSLHKLLSNITKEKDSDFTNLLGEKEGRKVILIKDECHVATKNID